MILDSVTKTVIPDILTDHRKDLMGLAVYQSIKNICLFDVCNLVRKFTLVF